MRKLKPQPKFQDLIYQFLDDNPQSVKQRFADRMKVTISTLYRWAAGTSCPHKLVRLRVAKILKAEFTTS
ncbi:MAG: hypothetical protein WC250_02530 [Candidatus Paceibacterota bacterium]|jgi:hypothetical protein